MAYVIRNKEVGYYAPDGTWVKHAFFYRLQDAEREANILNGGDGGAAAELARENRQAQRDLAETVRQAERDRENAEQAIAYARQEAAQREANNLAAQARLQQDAAQAAADQLAATAAETARAQQEWVRAQEQNHANWLVAQEEARRRAQVEAAEQLKKWPPTQRVIVGGLQDWDGTVAYRLKSGEWVHSVPAR